MHTVCRRSASLAETLLIAGGLLAFAADGLAQPSDAPAPENVAQADGAAAEQGGVAEEPADSLFDGAFVPDDTPGLAPMATYVAPVDEITVRGARPGEIRTRLWNLDTEIERTVIDFYKMLNEIVVDEQFHVICEWGGRQLQPGVESRIQERFCFTGYQLVELRTKRDVEREGGYYEPDQAWLAQKEEEFSEVVLAAMDANPALTVAAENLVRMHEERLALTGGDPAMSLAQLDRQRARDSARAPMERRELRRQRETEREAERAAEREAERQAQRADARR